MNLCIEGLTHIYPGASRPTIAVEHWEIGAGGQALLRGVSGSGKTTLFNILAGLLRPSQGSIQYDQQNIYALSEAQRDRFRALNVGYVFQNHHLIPSLTALENVIMPMAFARAASASAWRLRARDLLAQVGLADFAHALPRRLSTGQRLRVAVARALANTPRLLLADEPTAALDSESGAIVMDLLQATCRASSAILLVASHDPALMERFESVVDLHAGRLFPVEAPPA